MNGSGGEPILKKTLVTVAVMVGAWVVFVGTASLVAVLVTSHAVGGSSEAVDVHEGSDKVPPSVRPGATGRSRPGASQAPTPPRGHETI
jgi:hypothetical protein